MGREQIVEHYLEKSREPGFEIDQIRKELEGQQVPEEDIRAIVRDVDNELQTRALAGLGKDYSRQVMVTGAILTVLGAGLTIGTYLGWISSGNTVVIAYGPFLVGIATIISGFYMKSKATPERERISRSIKRPL